MLHALGITLSEGNGLLNCIDWRYCAFMSCFEAYRSQKRLRAADMQDISYFVLGNKISL